MVEDVGGIVVEDVGSVVVEDVGGAVVSSCLVIEAVGDVVVELVVALFDLQPVYPDIVIASIMVKKVGITDLFFHSFLPSFTKLALEFD